jgi:glycine C-acetyltransferase
MSRTFLNQQRNALCQMERDGLLKREQLITGPQGGRITLLANGSNRNFLNLCANNYLDLCNHPDIILAAKQALDDFGFGMASVRFICGTQTPHRKLKRRSRDTCIATMQSHLPP